MATHTFDSLRTDFPANVAIVAADLAEQLVTRMRKNVYGSEGCIIGMVKQEPAGIVAMQTGFGGTRIVDMLVGEQLPRIC